MMRNSHFLLATLFLLAAACSRSYGCTSYKAYSAVVDSAVSSSFGGHTLYLFNTSLTNGTQQFVFQAAGSFEIKGSSATLTGTLVPSGTSSNASGFHLLLTLSEATTTFMGMNELLPSATVDTSSWAYFTVASPSYLIGFGEFAGSQFDVAQQQQDMPWQMGAGANGKNLNFGAAVWLNVVSGSTVIACDINIDLNCTSSICPGSADMIATAAEVDSYAQYTGGVAVSVFDLPAAYANYSTWVFASNSGRVRISGDNLHISGVIVPTANPKSSVQLTVNLLFTAAPASFVDSDPHKELLPSAYVQANGPIDPSTWSHFFLVPAQSSISDKLGFTLLLTTQMGMPLQVGYGANGKNIKLGASGWFDYSINSSHGQLSGSLDINLDLDCSAESSSESSSSSSSAPAGSSSDDACHVTFTSSVANTWIENGRNTSLVYVTMTNTGSEALTDVNVRLNLHADDCSSFAPSCIRQIWSLSSCANADAASCVFHLPSWLTQYGGLAVGATTNWGFISYTAPTGISVQAIC